ncbi:multicopper oxidase domain-containing protein [Hymenobacter sp. UYAg731]
MPFWRHAHLRRRRTALIYGHNRTRKTVLFHWPVILLPNRHDGLPILNMELIEPGQMHELRFALRQHGPS